MKGLPALLVFLIVAGLFTACVPHRDPIDMAYEAYTDKRNSCTNNACRQVAAQEFAGAVENAANNWEKWKSPAQWQTRPNIEPRMEVTIDPEPPFTPTLPKAGPTRSAEDRIYKNAPFEGDGDADSEDEATDTVDGN